MSATDEMYRRIVEAVPEGVWVVNPQGQTIFSNRRMAEILGTGFEAMPEQSCFACVFPEDLADAQRNFARTLAGDRRPFEFRLRRANGSPIWVSISCMPLCDDTGTPVGLFGLFSDISERKQAEAALRESEERFRAIFNLAAVGVAQASVTGNLELVNDQYCEIIGYTREELLGRNLREISHPDDLQEVMENTRRLLAGEIQFFCMDKRYIRKDGGIIWSRLHKSCVRDPEGRPKHSIVVLEDVTEARRAQAALRESEERFRDMADSAPILIWLSDSDGKITFCNKQVLIFTGRTEEQLAGEAFMEPVHPEDRERVGSTVWSAVRARCSFEIELRLRRADGEYRFMFTTGTPRIAGGKYIGHITITADITELKRKTDSVLGMQKLESLGVLAAGIAHDFNNLLGGILASAELLLAERTEGLTLDEEQLLRIRTASIRGGEVVRQLMIYAGEENRTFEPIDISRLVREMLQLLKVSISKRAILKVNVPDGLPAVLANAAQIRQVVVNLITNASEALGEKEGNITVTVAQVRSDDCAASLSGGDYVRLEVSDSGAGMPEDVQSKIFDPFFTTKFAGRGLGLAAVQGIVRSHGGTINVVSAPGQGSRFEILLPCSSGLEWQKHSTTASNAGEVASFAGTVLFVEDEDTLRLAVSKMLRRQGFNVIEAPNGKTAVGIFQANAPEIEVVLLDLTLPGMSGGEVLSELRRIQPHVKVIITSAYSHDWAQTALGGQHPWLYIRKPFQFNELTGLLRNVCSQSR